MAAGPPSRESDILHHHGTTVAKNRHKAFTSVYCSGLEIQPTLRLTTYFMYCPAPQRILSSGLKINLFQPVHFLSNDDVSVLIIRSMDRPKFIRNWSMAYPCCLYLVQSCCSLPGKDYRCVHHAAKVCDSDLRQVDVIVLCFLSVLLPWSLNNSSHRLQLFTRHPPSFKDI